MSRRKTSGGERPISAVEDDHREIGEQPAPVRTGEGPGPPGLPGPGGRP